MAKAEALGDRRLLTRERLPVPEHTQVAIDKPQSHRLASLEQRAMEPGFQAAKNKALDAVEAVFPSPARKARRYLEPSARRLPDFVAGPVCIRQVE